MTRRARARWRRAVNRAVRRYKSEGNLQPPRHGGDTVRSLSGYLMKIELLHQAGWTRGAYEFVETWGKGKR